MSNLKIGWSKRPISIDGPVSIPGQFYMRISEKILDPLYATAMCIDGGEGQDTAIFCTCDIGAIPDDILVPIRQQVNALCPQLPAETIIMGATHSHSSITMSETPEKAPDGQPIYPGSKCREHFINQCAEAIVEAWNTRSEGGFAYGYGYAVVAHSRRVVYFDDTSLRHGAKLTAPNGHGIMYGNTNDDQFSHYEAGSDHFLNAMFTFDKENKLTGIVVNVPCPSQLSEHFTAQSSDFWNEVRVGIAKEYGEDVYVLPQCAAAGDLSPRVLHYNYAQARRFKLKYGVEASAFDFNAKTPESYNKVMCERRDIAERIVEAVRDVYSWAKKDIRTDVPVYHEIRTLQLPRRKITDADKQWCEETIAYMDTQLEEAKKGTPEEVRVAVSTHTAIVNRNKHAIARWETQKTDPNYPMECHVVRMGDMAFATNQFELYMDFMHRIQARSPFVQTFIVQLAGDGGASYLPTERGVYNKGYSASIFCNQVGPEGGQALVEGTLEMLNAAAKR